MNSPIDRNALAKDWVHSYEEDAAGVQVFRTAGFAFPPSRGRDGLGLHLDGTLQRSGAGPTDRSSAGRVGTWTLDGSHLTLQQGTVKLQFFIECVAADKLRLRSAPTGPS
jgi:hypothetical protein